ncbi:alpha-mannosidase [Bifidobacterium longum]|uniref:alpha-mannosidase n=1 Tax=Bifidobacterium longum TaxID=216816 RepID=UPI0010402436|nr:glycoside hydrolase family 38 C-terminal domain-containing protein [Bifidobacterium longum]TCE66684.1 alpha-mannosidase [Bifidobacterium longum subsp. longum]
MFLKPEQQLERCKRIVRQRVDPHIHPSIAQLAVESFDIPGEPMPTDEFFAKLNRGDIDFKPFTLGSEWGTTWGTVWFRLTGTVPAGYPKGKPLELILDLGWYPHSCGGHIEGLVYRADGTAIKAVHPLNYWVPFMDAEGNAQVSVAEDGSFTLYLEAASNPLLLGVPPFVETELGDHATGKPDEPYVFKSADLTEFDARFENYSVDLDVVSSLMEFADKQSPRYWQLAKALQRSLNAYDERNPESVEAARAALAGVLAKPANASAMNVSAIGHAHIDSAWLWPVRETRRKVARTVSNALALMDADPDFKYAMSSAQQYAWLEEDHPDIFKRMKRRIEEGRFIPVGGMWVEADGMLPAGESLIRQIAYGRKYFKEHLGVEPKGVWLPDSFGYTGAWPQIARRAGYEWFLTQKISWNDTTKFPHHSFMWEGIDGTRILTHFPPSDTYCSWMSMHELMYSQRNFLDKDLSRNAILLYGFGDGGGGPTREMTARIRRDHDLAGVPKIEFGTPDQLFDRVRKDIVDDAQGETPVFKGELYLELHRATLTAQQDMKRGCRQEESMLRVAEYLCAAARIKNPDYVYPREELDRIWKTLLLNQFHDILPGSAIAWVHRQARVEYARDVARLNEIALEAGRAIAAVEPDDATITDAVIAPYSRQACEAWVVRPASSRAEAGTASMARVAVTHDGDAIVLDNGQLHVRIEADGTVSSIVDQRTNRELVPAGTRLGRYEMLKDEPFHWDAWDIQRDAFLTANALSEASITSVDETANGGAVVHAVTRAKGVEIRTGIALRPGSATLDFTADVDWHAVEQFLKVDMPVTVQAVNAQYECQYGLVERPINKNTRSDDAKFESCTHRFVRIADADYAAAVVNASTYGSDVSPIHADTAHGTGRGTMVRLSLLSAPLYPDPRTDQGAHSFAWSLVADADMNAVLDEAARLNSPVIGELPDLAPLVSLTDVTGTIVLDWVKLADDGSDDLIVRLYEAAGGNAAAALRLDAALADAKASVQEVNLMEEPELDAELPRALAGDEPMPADGAVVSLAPFQLTTLRIRR